MFPSLSQTKGEWVQASSAKISGNHLGGRYVVDQAASGHDEWIFCQVIYFFVLL